MGEMRALKLLGGAEEKTHYVQDPAKHNSPRVMSGSVTVGNGHPMHGATGGSYDGQQQLQHISPAPPKSPKNYSFQRNADYSPRSGVPIQGHFQQQQQNTEHHLVNSPSSNQQPPFYNHGAEDVMVTPRMDQQQQYYNTEPHVDHVSNPSQHYQRPRTASTSGRRYTSGHKEYVSSPQQPQRVGSALHARRQNAKAFSSPMHMMRQISDTDGPFESSPSDRHQRTPQSARQQRSIVPPSVQPISKMDFERLAGLMRLASKISPQKSSTPVQAPTIPSSSKNLSNKNSPASTKKKIKKKKSKRLHSVSAETQTDEEFIQTFEYLKEQNVELEKRLVRAENDSMLWKARFHAYKNESEILISDLQKKHIGFKAKVKNIQEKNSNLDALHREHQKQVSRLNDSHKSRIILAQQSHKLALDDVRKDYEVKLQLLKDNLTDSLTEANANIEKSYAYADTLKEEHAHEIERLQNDRDVQLEKMRINDYKYQKEIQNLNREFKRQIEEVHKKYQANAESTRLSHENSLETQKKHNKEEHDKLREEFEQKVTSVKRSYEKQMAELKQSYETELLDLKYKYDKMITHQKKEHDALFVELKSEHERKMQQLKGTHEKMIQDIEHENTTKEDADNYNLDEEDSASDEFLHVIRHLIQLNEDKVNDYYTYIVKLKTAFQDKKQEALSMLPADEDTMAQVPGVSLSELQHKHNSMLHQIESIKSSYAEQCKTSDETFKVKLDELQMDADRTRRMVDDLQRFASKLQGPLKSQTEATILHVQSQYSELLDNLKTHVNVLLMNEQKWKNGSKEETEHDEINQLSVHQSTAQDSKTVTFNTDSQVAQAPPHPTSSERRKTTTPLADDTMSVLESIQNFVVEDPLS